MSLLSKLRVAVRDPVSRPAQTGNRPGAQPLHATPARTAPDPAVRSGRFSNGLKEFLWHLDGVGRGQLLDLGQVSQSTLNFFIERGFKVYTEDLLSSWQAFLRAEEESLRQIPEGAERPDASAGARSERFLSANLGHAAQSFDAVLAWDILDYLDKETVSAVVARLSRLVRDGGAIFALFHTHLPEEFNRYRILDAQTLEVVPAAPLVQPVRVYQNREIQDLLQRFRSSKTFVGRDRLREGVFVK